MDTITVELTTMAHGGDALGRHEGKVIFVPYTIPGETVRAEITDDREHYAFARLVEVLEPSPDRVEAPCPYFGPERCGGCQWQHVAYGAQLGLKADILVEQLERIGEVREPLVHPTLPDETGWAYRNHAQFHPAPGGGLGFQTASSGESGRDIIAVEHCMVLHPFLSDLYDAIDLDVGGLIRLVLRAGTATGERLIGFEMEEDRPPALESDETVSCVLLLSEGGYANLIGDNYITEVVAGHTYRISAPSFFQVNTPQAGELVRQALGYLDLEGGETVLDAYCGVGLFTTHLAERAELVIGVESSPSAVDDLLVNTEDQDNVEIVEGAVEDVLPEIGVPIDAVLLDPPRGGVDRFALDGLVALEPGRIVYVSCDPATLARDAKRLARGGYRLVETQPVDLFPQTYHVESVSLFSLE
ncbi:MAG: 23S rRNA (uracil(1939)-C(5))-methyltransferase RlmD [Chloroflexota bacterium]